MTASSIEINATIEASRWRTWALITEPEHLSEWFGSHIKLDARLGGRMEEHWEQGGRKMATTGIIDAYDPPHLLSMTWADTDWPAETRVTIRLEESGEHTLLTLTHAGWDGLSDLDHERLSKQHEEGWESHLISLTRYAADLRMGSA